MDVPVSDSRLAQLEDFARRRGKDTASALDEVLPEYLDWGRKDYEEAVEGVQKGLDDVRAGLTEPAEAFLEDFARKHGLPG